ncbi:MAG: hydantoinase B/oxoprolinase family protein [Chloroflexi bacterium]|nr:hydantoinase B/oxoprolinase family protein [Chloroflexota bacterium]
MTESLVAIDPITLEVVQEGFVSTVREMWANLARTAYSAVIYEMHDFSCALVDKDAQLVAMAEGNPSHIFPIVWSVRGMFERYGDDIAPGDIFLHNDPYTGGTHLNDVVMLCPIFFGDELGIFPAVRAHWQDVGGMTPGSLSGKATEIFQEGLRVPLIRAFRRGEPIPEVLDLIFANMRVRHEREGDFEAILGTCRIAEQRLRAMADKFGLETIKTGAQSLLDRSESRMRQHFASIPDGDYGYEAYLDYAGDTTDPLPIRMSLQVQGDTLHADFTGTSPQVNGPMNGGPAVAPTAVFIALKALFDHGAPINQGNFRSISVHVPEGSVLNARAPAACGGFSELRRCIETMVVAALAGVTPETATGDNKGTANHVYIAGYRPPHGELSLLYEAAPAGTGAFRDGDGNNTCRSWNEGDFGTVQPAEVIESIYPMLVERCELRADSGGDGLRRGGLGMRRDVRVLTPRGSLSVLSDKCVIPPNGVYGGHPGAPNAFAVARNGTEHQPSSTPGKVSNYQLVEGDVVVIRTSGGGGYGDPLERDPADVALDVAEGYVTPERAYERYGVVIASDHVELAATERRRAELRQRRVYLNARAHASFNSENGRTSDEAVEGIVASRRICLVAPETAHQLGAVSGDLVEVIADAKPIRAWIEADARVPDDECWLGPSALAVLGGAQPIRVHVRKIDS